MSQTCMRSIAIVTTLLFAAALSGGGRPATASADWESRLNDLRPERPLAYFELAEDIADAATTQADRALARHLFALAGALDRARLGRSACLALADLSDDDLERRRLLALATLLDHSGAFTGQGESHLTIGGTGAALAVSQAFSHYRQGEGQRALAALREAGAMELLEAHARFIRGGVERFLEDCRSYRGRLRPTLPDRELQSMLELERALLATETMSWSTDLMLTGGAPFVEVDPEAIETALRIDSSRPYYRNGEWVDKP